MSDIQTNIDLETNDFGTKLAGIAGFLLLFVFGGSWLYSTELSSAIIVQGKVDIMGEAKTVQHRDGGVISSIRVVPGQEVTKDQLLIELDVSEHRIRADATIEKMKFLSARLYRLYAERKGFDLSNSPKLKPTKISSDSALDELARERDLMQTRKANRESKRLQATLKLEKLRNEIEGVENQIASKHEELSLLREELEAKKHLHEKGYSSLSSVRETQKDITLVKGAITRLRSQKFGLQHEVQENKETLHHDEIAFHESVLNEIISIEAEMREHKKNLLTDNTVIDRAAIRAPTAGKVHKMEVFTVGGVIGPSQELMQIVPEDSALEIGAKLETRYIDDLTVNQQAVVRLSGFDVRTTPELNAFVRSISPNVVTDAATGKPYYEIKVTVPPEEIKKLNISGLVPGMPAEIFVKTGERTALQYLTAPLVDQLRRAFRE
ncbi:MAG: HlyD family type I secretion periplasmic adaptor subunit [Pseudomonadota bacterium]